MLRKQFLIWLMGTRFFDWLLIHVIPYVRRTMYYTSFSGLSYHEGYELLRQGDVILCRDDKKLTTMLIGGTMTHACLCVGIRANGFHCEVVEMTHHDFTQSMFFDVCKEADRIVIMRCEDFDAAYIQELVDAAWTLKDAKYDVEFQLGIKSLYCSELVYESDLLATAKATMSDATEGRMKVSLEDLAGLGRPYISPDGLMFGKNMKCVWDSREEFTGLLGDAIKEKVSENKAANRK